MGKKLPKKGSKTLFFFILLHDSTMAKILAKCNIWNSKCEVGQVVGQYKMSNNWYTGLAL